MLLLAVSGGPDSMFLLNEYKNKKVVVAHVNYNTRNESNDEEELVRDFCHANKIPVEVLNVAKKPEGNFEAWARDVRYDFFKKIYDKYGCKKLLIAHHKDDFLETALMQQESGRTPRYFGIRKKMQNFGMNIYRPFIDVYWKRDIERDLDSKNISFSIDSSNSDTDYTRNKIRARLAKEKFSEKKNQYQWFRMSNKILVKKFKFIDKQYESWKKSNFDVKFFRALKKNKQEVVYEFVHDNFDKVKLSKGKLDGLIQFIEGVEGGKEFKLNSKVSLTKSKSILSWQNTIENTKLVKMQL